MAYHCLLKNELLGMGAKDLISVTILDSKDPSADWLIEKSDVVISTGTPQASHSRENKTFIILSPKLARVLLQDKADFYVKIPAVLLSFFFKR